MVVSLEHGSILKLYGSRETHLSFQAAALLSETSEKSKKDGEDPLLLVTALGKNRFFYFSNRAPVQSGENKNKFVRDI